jgi:hypothetical protein
VWLGGHHADDAGNGDDTPAVVQCTRHAWRAAVLLLQSCAFPAAP